MLNKKTRLEQNVFFSSYFHFFQNRIVEHIFLCKHNLSNSIYKNSYKRFLQKSEKQ